MCTAGFSIGRHSQEKLQINTTPAFRSWRNYPSCTVKRAISATPDNTNNINPNFYKKTYDYSFVI